MSCGLGQFCLHIQWHQSIVLVCSYENVCVCGGGGGGDGRIQCFNSDIVCPECACVVCMCVYEV